MLVEAGLWLCALSLGVATASYDAPLYDDLLIQDLYKRLADMQDYYPDAGEPADSGPAYWDSIALDSRDSGQADIRDPEFLAHSSNSNGFQRISGGAGEGKQHLMPDGLQPNVQEVKTDEGLPFYCHPPNPCPKGYTEEDGCQANVEDTAAEQKEWISRMQARGMCTCDEEHMFDCARTSSPSNNDQLIDSMLDSLLGGDKNNPNMAGEKRQYLVAKKSPRVKRSTAHQLKDTLQKRRHDNPYLQGRRLPTVAKKGAGPYFIPRP